MTMLEGMIKAAREQNASDLHLMAGMPPLVRVNGEILSLSGYDQLESSQVQAVMGPMIDEFQMQTFEKDWQLCFSRTISSLGYFRVSLYRRAGEMEASIRLGIMNIPSFEELGLPGIVEELARIPYGLILITGSTNAGKTTTFNAMLDLINRERRCKIITIEDPIEFIHRQQMSIVVQQEVGTDVKDFPSALNHALRQDPDVIGLGELREYETISSALLAAETGHLVIATLHTNDAVSTINRIVDVFPSHQHAQSRYQLAASLQGIINQRLLPRLDKEGRVLACEVMIATEAARNLIRENKIHQLENVISTGVSYGMQPMDHQVQDLYSRGIISFDTVESCGHSVKDSRGRPNKTT